MSSDTGMSCDTRIERVGIERVGVVGCGTMGAGIAECCARGGLPVRIAVSSAASLAAGQSRLSRSLEQGLRKGRLTAEECAAVQARIGFTTDLNDLADSQFVFEAISESEPAKVELFAALDKVLTDPDAILASNTSAIPIVRLARATRRPAAVIGTHFFSPVPMLPLVEVIESLLTGAQTRERTAALLTTVLGKTVVHSPDRSGFIVNALLIPYLLSAVRMVESGFATAEVIDQAMVLGLAYPVGPLKLADLIGLDIIAAVAQSLYEEFREPLYAPPPMLRRMVEGGLLGKKSGRGFYGYA
jgi:3-hydroxybutyryl-CoA dehydrogenase